MILNSSQITQIESKQNIHQKLIDCIVDMISTDLPFYGQFLQFVNFKEANISTCGVNVTGYGMNFYWGKDFVEKTPHKQLIFTAVHEVMHLLLKHNYRGIGFDKKIANLAADMIINSIIYADIYFIKKNDKGIPIYSNKIEILKDDKDRNSVVFIPKEYEGAAIFEELYLWLNDRYTKWLKTYKPKHYSINVDKNCKITFIDDSTKLMNAESTIAGDYGSFGRSTDGDMLIDMYSIESFFETIERGEETFDIHFEDDVPDEVKQQFVESAIDKLRCRGIISDNVEKILNKLRKTEKDYLKEIKRYISNDIIGSKKIKTITRPNRRDILGLKGNKKQNLKINCILDTSGSMSGSFEKVLSYIFQKDISINLIQCDTEVKNFIIINNKKDLQKMPIKGLGGTILNPGLDYIASQPKLNSFPTVILTDGYTDKLDFRGIKNNVLILSIDQNCPTLREMRNIKVKQILINKN